MSNFLSHTVTLLVIKHTITPEHCTNIVPLCDKLYEAGQSCVCVFVMRPLRPIRVWSWRVLGTRWRRLANASALAHCRGRVRRCGPKSTYVYHIRLGVKRQQRTPNGISETRVGELSVTVYETI